MKIISLFGAALAITGFSMAHGQVIAVNYDQDSGGNFQFITDTTGVVPVAAADWNEVYKDFVNNDNPSYVDSSGNTVTGFSLTMGNAGNFQSGNTNLGNLLNTYGDHFGTFTATNVPYALYDVYVYVASDGDGRDAQGTIGSETLTFSSAAATATSFTVNSTPDANYSPYNTLLFQNVTGSSFTYTQTFVTQSVGMAGFEIVEVPEPKTWAMLFAGAALFFGALRFRRQVR